MTEKARVTQIKYAGLEFEGLMLPNGRYGIALSQISNLFLESRKLSTKQLQAMAGDNFKSHEHIVKCATELGKNKSVVVDLDGFGFLVTALAFKGNQSAINFAIASVQEKIERIFAKAFNQKFEEEAAEVKFQARLQHKKQYHPLLTKWLKVDNPDRTDWGKQINIFKACAGVPIESVDKYETDDLIRLNQAEVAYNTARKLGQSHEDALKVI